MKTLHKIHAPQASGRDLPVLPQRESERRRLAIKPPEMWRPKTAVGWYLGNIVTLLSLGETFGCDKVGATKLGSAILGITNYTECRNGIKRLLELDASNLPDVQIDKATKDILGNVPGAVALTCHPSEGDSYDSFRFTSAHTPELPILALRVTGQTHDETSAVTYYLQQT